MVREMGIGIRTEAEILSGVASISRGNVPPLPICNVPAYHSRQCSRQTARGGCRVPGTNVARRAPKRARADGRPDGRTACDPWAESVPQARPASNSSCAHHDVPPTRDPRPHRRPSTRRTDSAQSVLRRLQIVDSTDANPPLRHRRVLSSDTPYWTVEEDVSRPLQLSRSPHAQSHHPWNPGCHRRRCGCGWLDPHIPQPRALIFGVP
jgi:hypothetical protein